MMTDLISRQDAIDTINELHDKPNAWLDLAVEALEKLPSAQPKQRWIPCSERLPEFRYENVLVWYEYFNYDFNSMCRTYGIGYCSSEGTWHGDVSGTKARCLAWMPLPDAYEL